MIYTTLLEPYYYPRLIPIEVTILRGARRLRLSSSLQKRYKDFVPKIWNILAKLGYQKYLQRIYIAIDCPVVLTSQFYQLPIVIAVLQALNMLKIRQDIHCSGRFMPDYRLEAINNVRNGTRFTLNFPQCIQHIAVHDKDTLPSFLNQLYYTEKSRTKELHYPRTAYFPGVVFEKNAIDITKTSLGILKQLPTETIEKSEYIINLKKSFLSEQKLSFLYSTPRPEKILFAHQVCPCGANPCICTKSEKSKYQEQIELLREYSTLI